MAQKEFIATSIHVKAGAATSRLALLCSGLRKIFGETVEKNDYILVHYYIDHLH